MIHHNSPPPWYRQFWPWFLIALPASSVIAGISTVLIANHQPDGVVVDDYYKQGLAINQDLARDHRAAALALRARVELRRGGALAVDLQGKHLDALPALHVALLHPTKAGRDQRVLLQRGPDGGFHGVLDTLEGADWHIALEPPDRSWRLQGRLQWPQQPAVTIAAGS